MPRTSLLLAGWVSLLGACTDETANDSSRQPDASTPAGDDDGSGNDDDSIPPSDDSAADDDDSDDDSTAANDDASDDDSIATDDASDDGVSDDDSIAKDDDASDDDASDDDVSDDDSTGADDSASDDDSTAADDSASDDDLTDDDDSTGADDDVTDDDVSDDDSTAADDDSGDAGSPDDAGPGDEGRLVRRYLVGGEGAEGFQTLVDTQLGAPCAFEVGVFSEDPGTTYRCLPTEAAGSTAFTDPECTIEALSAAGDVSTGQVVSAVRRGVGDRGYYIVGEPVSSASAYRWNGTDCAAISGGIEGFLVTPAPATTFVTGVLEFDPPLPDGVEVGYVLAAGERYFETLRWDGATCVEYRPAGTDHPRCAPHTAVTFEFPLFAEATCDGAPLVSYSAAWFPADSEPPEYALELGVDSDGCDAWLGAYGFGAEQAVDGVYSGEPGQCYPFNYNPEESLHGLGQPVPFDAFPDLPGVTSGNGRLLHEARATSSLEPLYSVGWFDSELETPCTPQSLSGAIRCVPWGLADESILYFADELCSERLFQVNSSGCTTPAGRYFSFDGESVSELTPFAGPVYEDLGDVCAPQQSTPIDPLLGAGPALAPGTLAELLIEER